EHKNDDLMHVLSAGKSKIFFYLLYILSQFYN
ncbi:unnamed protein product, partial [marine sediment metagenome]